MEANWWWIYIVEGRRATESSSDACMAFGGIIFGRKSDMMAGNRVQLDVLPIQLWIDIFAYRKEKKLDYSFEVLGIANHIGMPLEQFFVVVVVVFSF